MDEPEEEASKGISRNPAHGEREPSFGRATDRT
jgi:hypothetical protein